MPHSVAEMTRPVDAGKKTSAGNWRRYLEALGEKYIKELGYESAEEMQRILVDSIRKNNGLPPKRW